MHNENVVIELSAIKKLLILALINSGMTHEQIASALGMDRSNISRMFPKGALTQKKSKGKPQ